jgi:hypothetical protein
MGYSLYISLRRKEVPLLRRLTNLLCAMDKSGELFKDGVRLVLYDPLAPPNETEELSYVATIHERRAYVGVDYGEHFRAHLFMHWLASKMGRSNFWYDGIEKVTVLSLNAYRASKKFPDLTVAEISEWEKKLDEAWNAATTEEGSEDRFVRVAAVLGFKHKSRNEWTRKGCDKIYHTREVESAVDAALTTSKSD